MKNLIKRSLGAMATGVCICGSAAVTIPADGYLMHSTGNHLGVKTDGYGTLSAKDDPTSVRFSFGPVSEGVVNVVTPDGRYLSLSGAYNTRYVSSNSSKDTRFAVEDVDGSFVRLQCQGNGRYLGTDGTTAGSAVFADKDGKSSLHYWYFSDSPESLPPTYTRTFVVNPDATLQGYEGWGVSLCWWANMCGKWSDEKIDEIVDWLVSPEGLNYNIFRYNIGGGDDPDNANCDPHHMDKGKGLRAEMEGFKDSADGPYIWTRDEAQRKIMLKIREKRPDAIFEAFSNSCPWYMTYSGCCSGHEDPWKDNLKPEYYEEFAHYLVDVCKHYKDEYGIEFRTLDPFNEPMTGYWGRNGGQEGCHFDVESQIDFLKVLHPILEASGLKTVISASDETDVAQAWQDIRKFTEAGVDKLVGQWNTHTYTANQNSRARFAMLAQATGKPVWMSEVGVGGSGIDGNLTLCQTIIDDIRNIMPGAWVDWQYIEENNDQWCLVRSNGPFQNQSYRRVKNYYLHQQFSRFITPGSTLLNVADPQTLAAHTPEGNLVIVTLNAGALRTDYTVDLSMYAKVGTPDDARVTSPSSDFGGFSEYSLDSKTLTYSMPAQSVVTFLIPVTAPEARPVTLNACDTYVISPRTAPGLVLESANGGLQIGRASFGDTQLWRLEPEGEKWRLKNLAGYMPTVNGNDYMLEAMNTPADGQLFDIAKIDGHAYRIGTDVSGKAFDLNGEGYTAGTAVGFWKYDDGVPAHRQWFFIPVSGSLLGSVEAIGSDSKGEFLFNVSVADGFLTLGNASDAPADVTVYSASGEKVYAAKNVGESLTIPLPTGCYVVRADAAARTLLVP